MNLKRIMTDLAAGHITKQEADKLIKENKVAEETPVQAIKEGNEVSPDFIGDNPKDMKEGTITPKIQKKSKSLGGKK